MAKIPFTLEAWLKDTSQKVELKNGNCVRILAWDLPGDFPIVAVDWPKDDEIDTSVESYDKNGWDGIGIMKSRLFIVTPEPELTKFEESLWSFLKLECSPIDHIEKLPDNEKMLFHKYAAELLELARKELIEEQYTSDPRKTDLYKLGKAEALKDLPRWKKTTLGQDALFLGCRNKYELFYKDRVIALSELEKLPGFKED